MDPKVILVDFCFHISFADQSHTDNIQAWVCSMIANSMVDTEELRDVKAAFAQWDTKQDGTLTEDEIEEHMAEICAHFNMEQVNVRNLLNRFCTHHL